MKRILMRTVPHPFQEYDTCGNYRSGHGLICFTVSEMGNEWYERLVAIHELVEQTLAEYRGIPESSIDAFDKAYETNRDPGDEDEPGNSQTAPYHREHVFATTIERLIAEEMGLDWSDYEIAIAKLEYGRPS